jgi:hypothetical protein
MPGHRRRAFSGGLVGISFVMAAQVAYYLSMMEFWVPVADWLSGECGGSLKIESGL